MSTASLIILIIAAVLGMFLLPFCMICCRLCALRAIRNIGANNDDDDQGDLYLQERRRSDNHSDDVMRGEREDGRAKRGERHRKKREKYILDRVAVKVRRFLSFFFCNGGIFILYTCYA